MGIIEFANVRFSHLPIVRVREEVSEVGDMREVFDAMKASAKERKQSNMKKNMDILNAAGIDYEVHNKGYQLNVKTYTQHVVAFYPSTNKWVGKHGKVYYGDAHALLQWLRGEVI